MTTAPTAERYLTVAKFVDETGYTDSAVRNKISKGVWLEGVHYLRSPDGKIHMEMGAYYKWLKNEKQSA